LTLFFGSAVQGCFREDKAGCETMRDVIYNKSEIIERVIAFHLEGAIEFKNKIIYENC
jgi:hypothetical protein